MLKISHITKTFGLGTTDAKKALDDLCQAIDKFIK